MARTTGYPAVEWSNKVQMILTLAAISGIKEVAAVAATRGDLGQLAPRKKLLKSW